MEVASEFRTKILRRCATPDEYTIYRAGLEWDLADPIVIRNQDDFKSANLWEDRLTPYYHQVSNLITFCRRLPVTLLADDVGLGKTISAGLIASELISRSRLSKVLIVCPKLLGPQWKAELHEKFGIKSEIAIGKDLTDADLEDGGAIITTYNSARLHLDAIPEDRFQMLILDEAHKLRNLYGVEKPPQVAKKFRKALEDRRFRFVLMLTATPIQNRLWDLYSLVDLLSVARGHENPFGGEGLFARRFIADKRTDARQLKSEAQEEFRSIVYGYMSRVRRDDAKLSFPKRVIQMHRVDPTPAELLLIRTIAEPIQKLNRLVQISILKALASSPEALSAQLNNMARNGTVPQGLASTVQSIVTNMPMSAKLQGLGKLIDQLKKENPDRWRLVVFTTLRETQTTIQLFLESQGLKVGIINGDSGERNQETIVKFRKNPPDCRVIVSTEAGAEGVNLQVANVLVNYDLPWNPMIVEQRIGRVQRLASAHAHVSIFNVMLRGTFEEYIVGRLMEKLQMAAHAIGDIESLLQGSDTGDDDTDEDKAAGFEDKILKLVLAALAGKDVEQEARLAAESIDRAKATLESEEENINKILGSMDGSEYVGPQAPELPGVVRSMDVRKFTLASLLVLGARVTQHPPDLYLIEENGGREHIRFQEHSAANIRSTLYAPGNAAFQRLVTRVITSGVHNVSDLDDEPSKRIEEIARDWAQSFGAKLKQVEPIETSRCFEGTSLVRVRATVAHDSYERLVNVKCSPEEHSAVSGPSALGPVAKLIEAPASVGINVTKLEEAARLDDAISEFSRFYLERREHETVAAGADERKRKKLEDEFTPRLVMTLVGMEGKLYRRVKVRASYSFEDSSTYDSEITVLPYQNELTDAPISDLCLRSGRSVPRSCLTKCDVTGGEALRHLLVKSDVSGRFALPEFAATCTLSGKRILEDEGERSAVSGKLVASSLLKVSGLSGKRAEPEHFVRCEFTGVDLLSTECSTSEFSAKLYRADEKMKSAVSGKTGHKLEFTTCHETRQPIALMEAEQCEVTGKSVRPGILEKCSATNKRVLPSELERCGATGRRALKDLLVTSSLSYEKVLEEIAVRSASGKFCTPAEVQSCLWSGGKYHPDDIRICTLTGISVHFRFVTAEKPPRLSALLELLNGTQSPADSSATWERVAEVVSSGLGGGHCAIEAAARSPAGNHLATSSTIKTFMRLRVRHAGAVYEVASQTIIGRIAEGHREAGHWSPTRR
jgi:ERCC4-related helicase